MDGLHCPSPSPPGFPLLKDNRRGLLSPLRSVPVANPSFYGSKGEGQPPPRGRGLKGKKNANVHVCVFFVKGGILPPPPPHRHGGAYSARPDFRFPIMLCVICPRLA
jgi:hypothetical protein